jgi:hypothetical protein
LVKLLAYLIDISEAYVERIGIRMAQWFEGNSNPGPAGSLRIAPGSDRTPRRDRVTPIKIGEDGRRLEAPDLVDRPRGKL